MFCYEMKDEGPCEFQCKDCKVKFQKYMIDDRQLCRFCAWNLDNPEERAKIRDQMAKDIAWCNEHCDPEGCDCFAGG